MTWDEVETETAKLIVRIILALDDDMPQNNITQKQEPNRSKRSNGKRVSNKETRQKITHSENSAVDTNQVKRFR